MKRILLMAAMAMTMFNVSCSKTNDGEVEPFPDPSYIPPCLLTGMVDDISKVTYTHDTKGKIISKKPDNWYATTFKYSSNQIVTGDYVYKLDAQGRITSMDIGNSQNAETYIYDLEGYMIEKQMTSPSGVRSSEKYKYTNGNLTSITREDGKTATITYGNGLTNFNFYYDLKGVDKLLINYFGKRSTNLPTKWEENTDTWQLLYEKNQEGNIVKMITQILDNGTFREVTRESYSYTCK